MNTERPTIRRRPARPVEADPVPSNVVQLRPQLVHDTCAPETTICAPMTTGKLSVFPSENSAIASPMSSRGVVPHVDVSCTRANAVLSKAEFQALVKRLSGKELEERFSLDHSSWKDMKGRRRNGCAIHKDFRSFRSFLRHMGVPRPNSDWTLDRISPFRKEYGPGLCRWAPRDVQANNRTDTIHLTGPDGRTLPLTDWAALTGQDPKTIRKRRDRHPEWSDVEVIAGRQETGSAAPKAAPEATLSPMPAAEVASLDGWPAEASADRWEAAFVAFERRFAHWLGPHFRRAVFFAWLTGNKARLFHARIKARHPGFDDPDCACPPNLDGDADYAFYAKLSRAHSSAWRAVLSNPKAYDVLLGLQRGFPMETDPITASRMTWKRDDDGGGWQ